MKKLLLGITLIATLFASNVYAEVTSGDWIWLGSDWVYTGSLDSGVPVPPPPPPIKW